MMISFWAKLLMIAQIHRTGVITPAFLQQSVTGIPFADKIYNFPLKLFLNSLETKGNEHKVMLQISTEFRTVSVAFNQRVGLIV